MKLLSLLALIGARSLAKSARRQDGCSPFDMVLLALHVSRRRDAAREIRRYRHLLDDHHVASATHKRAQSSPAGLTQQV